MIKNKIFIFILLLLLFLLLIRLFSNYINNSEYFADNNSSDLNNDPKNNLLDYTDANNKNIIVENKSLDDKNTTKLSGLSLEFKNDRPFAKEQPYNRFFDEIKTEKPPSTLWEDKMFEDVKAFDNDPEGRAGLDMCLEACDGLCVEFGQTGIAHCYPNPEKKQIKTIYYENLRDNTYSTENIDERPDKLIFSNLR